MWPHSGLYMTRKLAVKSLMIKLRVSAADAKLWREAAMADRSPLADWIRRRCDGRPATAPKLSKGTR